MADRAHLSIGEVLSLLQQEFPDITISKIRFLESQGLLDPERTPSGYRKFYDGDVTRLRWILVQQRENFLPLKVIKERLDDDVDLAAIEAEGAARGVPPTAPADPPAPSPAPAGSVPGARPDEGAVPIWMADAARAKAGRGRTGPAATMGDGAPPLDPGPTSVTLNRDELCAASGLTGPQIDELAGFGLLSARIIGPDTYFEGDDLIVAQKAAAFLELGIEPRHLRMFKVAADREASVIETLVLPRVRQRDPETRRVALERMAEMADLGQGLRAALLRRALSGYTR